MAIEKSSGITYRKWCAPRPRATLLLVHGVGTHSGRWEAAAEFFVKKGITSYAIELIEPDLAAKNRTEAETFKSFSSRILALRALIERETPSTNIFLCGESLGALISFLICAGRPAPFEGLICLAPAFATIKKLTLAECVSMLAPLFYDPGRQFALPFDTALLTRDPVYRKRLDEDPREYRTISSRLIFEIFIAQIRVRIMKGKIRTPVLFLLAGDDRIVVSAAAKALFDRLTVKDKTLLEFLGMYHSLSIEEGREAVFEEMARWVEKRSAR